MNLRILTWNIQFFSSSKVEAEFKGPLIQQMASGAGIAADIFVVVEVRSGSAPLGQPINGSGARAVITLLGMLGGNWQLVPPLALTDSRAREGIAVYFNSAKVTCTGPTEQFSYAGSVFEDLPGPAANDLAGQYQFFNPADEEEEVWFPFSRNRRPWLVTFKTNDPAQTPFGILAFHAAPVKAGPRVTRQEAYRGTEALAEITPDLPRSLLVTGDFNCNTFDPEYSAAYVPLENQGFVRQFNAVATVCSPVRSSFPTQFLVQDDYDNFLTSNVQVNGAAVVDPVNGAPPGYPRLQSYQDNLFNPATIPVNTFRARWNYKVVRGTSDHLPIYVHVVI